MQHIEPPEKRHFDWKQNEFLCGNNDSLQRKINKKTGIKQFSRNKTQQIMIFRYSNWKEIPSQIGTKTTNKIEREINIGHNN